MRKSAHTGTWVWILEEYKASFGMIDWGLDWIADKRSGDSPISDYEEERKTIEGEISEWRKFLKTNSTQDVSKAANAELKHLESKISTIKKLFKPVGKKHSSKNNLEGGKGKHIKTETDI